MLTEPSALKLKNKILELCRKMAGSRGIVAALMYGPSICGYGDKESDINLLLILESNRPILRCHLKSLNNRGFPNVLVMVVDQNFFEKDVNGEWLGGLLVDNILTPYKPLINEDYIREQEKKAKKRLTLELINNLVLSYPEMSSEILIKPEYFLLESIKRKALLFPLITYRFINILKIDPKGENFNLMMKGFREALDELIKEKVLVIQDNFLKINEEYIKKFRRKRIFIINVLESLRKRIIRYILAVFPRIIRPLIMEKELYMKLTEGGNITSLLKTKSLIFWDKSIMASPLSLSSADDAMIEEYLKRSISEAPIDQLEDSEKYIYVETPLGPVAFSERITIDDFLKRIIPPGEPHAVLIRKIGGVLNTVYMIDVKRKDREEIYVVKIFKDWYGLKWFPLALWSFGTRGFSVLGRSRLEREFAVNRYLKSKGINVPRILYVSPKECMIFEEFVEGQNLTEIIRNLIISKGLAPSLQEIIRKVGAEIARIHSLGVSLGDCKPENILVCKDSRICFLDLEQASKGGDKAWDLAEFLYYSGHYVPPFMADVMKSIAREFCEGYLKEGGEPLNLKKARSLRYVKVFSFFTPPNIVFAVREACREILNTHITN